MIAAYDDRNFCMLPDNDPNITNEVRLFSPWMGGNSKNFMQGTQISLIRPSRKSRMVKVLKGEVPVTLLAEQRPVVVSDRILSAKGKKIKVGTTTWHLQDIGLAPEMGNQNYRIKASITESGGGKEGPADANWANTLFQRVEIHDAKGNKFLMQGIQWDMVSPTSAQGTLMFCEPPTGTVGPPVKLIQFDWITFSHQVSFEFKNLPLP
jgi:hypothetical protein